MKTSRLALRSASRIVPALLFIAIPGKARAQSSHAKQEASPAKQDGLTLQASRKIEFSTDEGTWMSLDVSSDGRRIVFDLAGYLYVLSIEGGKAVPITSGFSFNSQPRFSPDGKQIVYVSDRSGAQNVWVSNADGSGARQLTSDVSAMFTSPSWTRDGRFILVSRLMPRAYDAPFLLMMYDVQGGSGIAVSQGKADEKPTEQVLGAVTSPDWRYFYYEAGPAAFTETPKWQIARRDLQTGEEETLTNQERGAFRPLVSPDGTKLVYGIHGDSGAILRIRDLATGEERWLKKLVERDSQESGMTDRDVLPGYAFTPDSQSIVVASGGKIHALNVTTGEDRTIAFQAMISRELGPKLNFPGRVPTGPVEARLVQGAVESPDGTQIAFSALGHLYKVVRQPGAKPQRATSSNDREFQPAWSPDGKWLTYVTWSAAGGSVWKIGTEGSGGPIKLTSTLAYYCQPAWALDGLSVVALRAPQSVVLGRAVEWLRPVDGLELVSIPSDGGPTKMILPAPHYTFPHFAGKERLLFVTELQKPNLLNVDYLLVSMRADGSDRHTLLRLTHKNIGAGDPTPPIKIEVSPDGQRALAIYRSQVYVFDLPSAGGAAPTLDLSSPSVATRRLTSIGADLVGWAEAGKTITWSLGSTYFRLPLAEAETAFGPSAEPKKEGAKENAEQAKVSPNSPEAAGKVHPETQHIGVQVARSTPDGTVVLKGAKVVTMHGEEVLNSADIVIHNDRIQSVGGSGTISIPVDAKVIDVRGDTIVPGFIDTHAHWFNIRRGLLDLENWNFLATLAYGITAGRDPQTYTNDIFAYQDLADAGEIIGPRAFSTGPGIFSTNDFQTEEQAEKVISRYKDYYRTNLVKSYEVGDRRQRQFVVEACEKLQVMPTTEGGAEMTLDLTHVIDGYGGNEHQFPIAALYKDVVELVAKSGIYYTPTFIIGYYDGPGSETQYFEDTEIYNNPKLRRFIPRDILEAKTTGLPWFRKDKYVYPTGAASASAISKAGGKVCVGGHGELQGLSFHWELWSLQSGGMSNLEALRAGTLNGAEALGLAQDLGSIEPGKLADLVILSKDPLEDIRNSTSIRFVMKNGELYDGDTLDEVWPKQQATGPFWWSNEQP